MPPTRSFLSAEPWYDGIANVIRAGVWLLVDVRVHHAERLPRTGPVLLAANHVSRLDPPVVGVVVYRLGRRVRFVVVEGLFDVPVVGWAMRTTRMIPVRRGGGAEPMVERACAALADGQVVIVYPEGTIPRPGQVLPGRPGAGLLALEAAAGGVPIIPVASCGLGREGHGPWWRRRLVRRPASVVFGPPVDLSAWGERRDRQAQIDASAAVLDAIRGLLAAAQPRGVPGTRKGPGR